MRSVDSVKLLIELDTAWSFSTPILIGQDDESHARHHTDATYEPVNVKAVRLSIHEVIQSYPDQLFTGVGLLFASFSLVLLFKRCVAIVLVVKISLVNFDSRVNPILLVAVAMLNFISAHLLSYVLTHL